MAKHFTLKDKMEIVRLKDEEGLTHAQIAEKLGRFTKAGKPNARAIMNQYKKAKDENVDAVVKAQVADAKLATSSSVGEIPEVTKLIEEDIKEPEQLNELSKRQRVTYLQERMNWSARAKHTFNNILDDDEKALFLEEYFSVIKEEDSLTSAEEQQLFQAILHLTLAMRASAQDRACWLKSPMSGYTGVDASPYIDVFKRDYHDNMKKYNDAMKGLKLSREQRLKDLQRHGTSFLDFAEKYARTDEQAKAAEEIMRLEEMSEEELVRLQANGWLIAGGLPDNNDVSFDGDRTSPEYRKNQEDRLKSKEEFLSDGQDEGDLPMQELSEDDSKTPADSVSD